MPIFSIMASILTGVLAAALLILGKKYSLHYRTQKVDILLSLIRFMILLTFLYSMLQKYGTGSILLIILFLVSYVGTVLIVMNKVVKE